VAWSQDLPVRHLLVMSLCLSLVRLPHSFRALHVYLSRLLELGNFRIVKRSFLHGRCHTFKRLVALVAFQTNFR